MHARPPCDFGLHCAPFAGALYVVVTQVLVDAPCGILQVAPGVRHGSDPLHVEPSLVYETGPRIKLSMKWMSSFGIGASSGIRPRPRPNGSVLVSHAIRALPSGADGSNWFESRTTRPFSTIVFRMPSSVSKT